MKRIFTIALALLVIAAAVPSMAQDNTATPQPAATAEPNVQPPQAPLVASTGFFVTSDFRSNVRSGPGTQYTVLGKLNPGDAVDVTGRDGEAGRWIRVNFNGQEGWISANVVDVTGDLTTAGIFEPGPNATLRQTPAQLNADAQKNILVVTRFNSNLRQTPSIDAPVLEIIPFDTQLEVIARSQQNNWVQVNFANQVGWISSGLVFFSQGNIETLPMVNADGVQIQPQATQEPAAQQQPTSP